MLWPAIICSMTCTACHELQADAASACNTCSHAHDLKYPVCTPQVMHAIGIAGTRLSFDREKSQLSHAAYLELAEACMSNDPSDRPPFHTMHIVSAASLDPGRVPS
jgi:hypothetical protein